jgi:transketolase
MSTDALAELSINTIRTLSIDAIQKANSGHPGLPLGAAPMAYTLWQQHLKHDPADPAWPDRDRFVLSPGHGSMLIYSLLHLAGYPLSVDDLANFRQWGSQCPGHPEYKHTAGVEATTGPLGQGAANIVGMAIAERALANAYNRPGHTIVDHYSFAIISDGDVMEGVAYEAASLAGHLGLGKLICLYDANDITLDGPADMTLTEDVCARYESCGWQVIKVENGDTDIAGLSKAIAEAKAETEKPTMIWVHTTIGFGSPNKAGKSSSHGSPLGVEEVALTKKALGWPSEEAFHVPSDVKAHMAEPGKSGGKQHAEWKERFAAYEKEHPELAASWKLAMAGKLPEGWDANLPGWKVGDSVATRAAAGKVQNAIAQTVPWLMGGDADLSCSTKTLINDGGSFDGKSGSGRNIHFGVREHAMGAICNGIDYHGGLRPYAATFFVFSDYMRPSVRVAALNSQPVIYCWTHDSIGLGEDGPTHQPVEQLMSLRVMPNLAVIRPADANETAAAWRYAMQRTSGPSALVLSRQNLPVQPGSEKADISRGAYVLADCEGTPSVILCATGGEVMHAMEAQATLKSEGIAARVVSMPCWEAFAEQDQSYRDEVLPPAVRARVSIEAGATLGWERWIGDAGEAIGVDQFGASAPAGVIFENYGITAAKVVEAAKRVIK